MSDLLNILLSSGLAQYPDKRLYNAATLLAPEERPTVPVRTTQLPSKRMMLRADADFDASRGDIRVYKESEPYRRKHPARLAALLAHEGLHAKQPDDHAEGPAYQRQLDVLGRLGETDQRYLTALRDVMHKFLATEENTKAPPSVGRDDLTPLQAAFRR